jgi:HEAT repeat protein
MSGCRTLETPTDLAAQVAAHDGFRLPHDEPSAARPAAVELPPPAELADDGWAPAATTDDAPAPTYHWQHAALRNLMAQPPEDRPDLAQLLTNDDPVTVTNAAILLARAGDDTVDRCLTESVRNEHLRLPQRRAAIEAIAGQDGAVAGPALAELLDDYSQPNADGYAPELHADLLRGLARHVDASANRYFAEALISRNAEVRQAGLYAYTISRTGVLPEHALELRKDTNPRVRGAALACLAARRHPQALEFAEAALADFHLDVRLAAVRALGELGEPQAKTDLQRLLIHEPEMIRAGAILALSAAGDDVTVFASANDPSWQVRRSVAQSLMHFPTQRGTTIARQLLADRSAEVRRAVIDSVAGWPLGQSGPVLLTAMHEAPFATRKQAAEQLARRWPPALEFNSDGPPESRAEQLNALSENWQRTQLAGEPWAVPMPAVRGTSLEVATAAQPSPTALAANHAVLNSADPRIELFNQLVAEDVQARRTAAHQLADNAGKTPFDASTVAQLTEIAMAETDSLVWRDLLRATKDDTSATAVRMAYVGASHAAADVRRLACGHLAMHPDPAHATVLLRLLDDPNRTVALSAVEALGAAGMVTDPAPLERLLTNDDAVLRVAAARTLAINGFASGPAALTRMAGDADVETRRQAVCAMGQLRDIAFLDALVGRLDDDLSVRVAAVASLEQIVGRDVNVGDGQTPPPLANQVQGWKQWWAEQPGRAEQAARPDAAQRR